MQADDPVRPCGLQRSGRAPRRRTAALEGILVGQDPEGLVFLPWDCVALLRDEGTGRLEITAADGTVAHCLEPLQRFASGPWRQVAPGVLAHPRHARREGGNLLFPGGWRIASDVDLPPPVTPPLDPVIPEIGVRASEVRYLECHADRATWVTDHGRLPAGAVGKQAARLIPDLVPLGDRYCIHRKRLRRTRFVRPDLWEVVLDDGVALPAHQKSKAVLLCALGLDSFLELVPMPAAVAPLFQEGLRDFPAELRMTPTDALRALFGSERRRLVANLAWQTVRMRRAGCDPGYGTSPREFWYLLVVPVLTRVLGRQLEEDWCGVGPVDPEYLHMLQVLGHLVGTDRLFTYEELGFVHERPELRQVGTARPDVILALEKDTMAHVAHPLAERFGCSLIIFGGQPKLLLVEAFVRDLRRAWDGPVTVLGWVDYDPAGYIIADAFRAQLLRYGVRTTRLRHLVRPACFTAEELALAAHPLEPVDKKGETMLAQWMARTHGIGGRPLGLHCDWLRDLERLAAIVRRESGMRDGGTPSRRKRAR